MKDIGNGRVELTNKKEVLDKLKKGATIFYDLSNCYFSGLEFISPLIFKQLKDKGKIKEIDSPKHPVTGQPTIVKQYILN